MRVWFPLIAVVACTGGTKDIDTDLTSTIDDADTDTDTDTDADTDTDTDTTPVDRNGTYVGMLDLTLEYVLQQPRWEVWCVEEVTFEVDSAADPMITGVGTCDASAGYLGVVDIQFQGEIIADPSAEGGFLLVGLGLNDQWVGEFDADNFSGAVNGSGAFQGGTLNWNGTWSADR